MATEANWIPGNLSYRPGFGKGSQIFPDSPRLLDTSSGSGCSCETFYCCCMLMKRQSLFSGSESPSLNYNSFCPATLQHDQNSGGSSSLLKILKDNIRKLEDIETYAFESSEDESLVQSKSYKGITGTKSRVIGVGSSSDEIYFKGSQLPAFEKMTGSVTEKYGLPSEEENDVSFTCSNLKLEIDSDCSMLDILSDPCSHSPPPSPILEDELLDSFTTEPQKLFPIGIADIKEEVISDNDSSGRRDELMTYDLDNILPNPLATKFRESRSRCLKFQCSIPSCRKRFSRHEAMIVHEKEHKLGDTKPFHCGVCDRSYSSKSSYVSHFKRHRQCMRCKCQLPNASISKSARNEDLMDNYCVSCQVSSKMQPQLPKMFG